MNEIVKSLMAELTSTWMSHQEPRPDEGPPMPTPGREPNPGDTPGKEPFPRPDPIPPTDPGDDEEPIRPVPPTR
jgi:hypothetical protein